MKPNYTIRLVYTMQADRKERLRRVRWYQAFDALGRPLCSPQPTAKLCRSAILNVYP